MVTLLQDFSPPDAPTLLPPGTVGVVLPATACAEDGVCGVAGDPILVAGGVAMETDAAEATGTVCEEK